ncbi:hypothetical protein CRUP_024180 [Coryphaenoides rupestris]|nr:hypothetical protein CRUP_024180 [Coryphaenoides rupestris]
MKSVLLLLLLSLAAVIGRHPTCNFLLELEREKAECDEHLNTQNLNATGKGVWCKGLWDNIACWEGVEVGGVVTISCPSVLTAVFGLHGNISRRCTAAGWSDVFPNITSTCGSEPTQDKLRSGLVCCALLSPPDAHSAGRREARPLSSRPLPLLQAPHPPSSRPLQALHPPSSRPLQAPHPPSSRPLQAPPGSSPPSRPSPPPPPGSSPPLLQAPPPLLQAPPPLLQAFSRLLPPLLQATPGSSPPSFRPLLQALPPSRLLCPLLQAPPSSFRHHI